ncbi:MAG: cupin domain-containing protein [Planctomycetota bacterium]|nr:cupin domain-containing protein [Planctomycetota bacterium]
MSESSAPEPVDLHAKMDEVRPLWTPHRVGRFDGHQLLLARVDGEFVWHQHDDHDEVFIPLRGTLLLDFEGGVTREVRPGSLLVVPKGVVHRPRTEGGEVEMLVLDPMGVKHTGDVQDERTVDEYPEL